MTLLSMHDILKFGSNLKEGMCFAIKHVRVEQAKPGYRVVPHQYQITLCRDAVVTYMADPNPEIPFANFNFVNFKDFPSLCNKTDILNGNFCGM